MEAGPRDSRQDPPPSSDARDGHPADAKPSHDDSPRDTAELLHDAPRDEPEPELPVVEESFRELRPPRLFRVWQLAPIVGCAVVGSLMFAFPLAFEFGDGGAVVAMLGLLISLSAGGWALMAARRVGYTLPGLPGRDEADRRADWRIVLLYAATVALLAALAIWRIARLR
ncbi:hypothetical protein SRB5_55500 [Streptomyces sp. RB5]|uniref:Transmembrane protein n=1 Tax=Streptomyces smaragdinus TaxID=2585196 RepID=A0A7K0CPP5_9ACTN|nr:hypothetical protein [Streptomyces smaragdinus]MQY15371.1 hypothetical protein [Streptomyces smaragdinus]